MRREAGRSASTTSTWARSPPYTGTYGSTDFDGEDAITSAIDYVVSEELPQLYLLEGHGESEQIEKENMETIPLSLLTVDEIPKDADCVVIYCPASDISPEEKEMLASYTAQSGKLLVIAGPTEDETLENLYGLLADYGVEACQGIVVEEDREHYAFQALYVLLPDMNSHAITASLIEESYYPIMPVSLGLTAAENFDRERVTALLTTSDLAFSKLAGYGLSTYEREDGDIDGPFALAVSISTSEEGGIAWFASSDFLEDLYNAYSSVANLDLAMNALSYLIGESEAIAIRSKSLNYNYLTISDSTASVLKVFMIGVFPLAYLGFGILVMMRRRRL